MYKASNYLTKNEIFQNIKSPITPPKTNTTHNIISNCSKLISSLPFIYTLKRETFVLISSVSLN